MMRTHLGDNPLVGDRISDLSLYQNPMISRLARKIQRTARHAACAKINCTSTHTIPPPEYLISTRVNIQGGDSTRVAVPWACRRVNQNWSSLNSVRRKAPRRGRKRRASPYSPFSEKIRLKATLNNFSG